MGCNAKASIMDRASWHIPDWLAGAEELSAEAEYAYFRLCLFLYQFDGLLKDDDQANARRCKMSTRAFRQVKAALLAADKLEIRDGYLWNARCAKEIGSVCSMSQAQSIRAQKRWQKARESQEKRSKKATENRENRQEKGCGNHEKHNEINDYSHATAYAGHDAISESRKVDNPDGLSPPLSPHHAEELAFAAYNELAERIGLPRANLLTKARKTALTARLKDCDGPEGWRAALAKVEASSFLRGERNDFRADLDFLLRRKSFIRLMEGSYDDRPNTGRAREQQDIMNVGANRSAPHEVLLSAAARVAAGYADGARLRDDHGSPLIDNCHFQVLGDPA